MDQKISELYARFGTSTWEEIDGLSDLLLIYDSMLAGVASSYLQGNNETNLGIPGPDAQWYRAMLELRKSQSVTQAEQQFLAYFEIAEELRISLKQARNDANAYVAHSLSISPTAADILYDALSDYHGMWRLVWDTQALNPSLGFEEVRRIVEEALLMLNKEGMISFHQSMLLPNSN